MWLGTQEKLKSPEWLNAKEEGKDERDENEERDESGK